VTLLVAAYTSTARGECIVFSNDRGRTWSEYQGNPVVKHQGRDPRLLWHAPTARWVMAVYDEFEGKRWIAFHTSSDLKRWEFQSRIEGFYECPDLFELPLDGHAATKKWVLAAASSEYRVGAFDGRQFSPETPMLPGHRGRGFYAAQTFSDVPPDDGRCIQIGWGQMPAPGMPFNQMMCFPCELTLRSTPEGPRLTWRPVKEIATLRARSHRLAPRPLKPGENPLAGLAGELWDLQVSLEPGNAAEVGVRVRGTAVVYDARRRELGCGDRRAPLVMADGRLRLQVLADRTSLEIFADDGLVYMPMPFRPGANSQPLEVFAQGGEARIVAVEAHELRSICPEPSAR
jgi:fructan beta-fructosidase